MLAIWWFMASVVLFICRFHILQIGGGTVCNLRFTVPTTSSRPSTKMSAFMYVCMFLSPFPVPWPERDILRNTIVLKRCCVS